MTRVIIFYSFNLNLHLASLFIFFLDLGIKQKILFFSASCGRIALKTCAKCSLCLVSFLPFISLLSIFSDVLGVKYIFPGILYFNDTIFFSYILLRHFAWIFFWFMFLYIFLFYVHKLPITSFYLAPYIFYGDLISLIDIYIRT